MCQKKSPEKFCGLNLTKKEIAELRKNFEIKISENLTTEIFAVFLNLSKKFFEKFAPEIADFGRKLKKNAAEKNFRARIFR